MDQRPTGFLFIEFTRNEENQWSLSLGDLDIQQVSLDLGSLPNLDLSKILQPWIRRAIEATPEISLGDLGGEHLPIRALRMGPTGEKSILIEARTDIRGGGALPSSMGPIDNNWEVQISQETITAMLRLRPTRSDAYGFRGDPKDIILKASNSGSTSACGASFAGDGGEITKSKDSSLWTTTSSDRSPIWKARVDQDSQVW